VYVCPVLSMCSDKFYLMYGWLIPFMCSLYLVINDLSFLFRIFFSITANQFVHFYFGVFFSLV